MIYDFLELERNSDVPLYQQLYSSISSAIENGKLPKDTKLPSIRRIAEDLNISRTTVETAYQQLCVEGYILSKPQRGYYVQADLMLPARQITARQQYTVQPSLKIKYNFGSDCVDSKNTDIKLWSSYIKSILKQEETLFAYGNPQGELLLRQALSLYSYGVRGTDVDESRIIIGSGTQSLLYILCGILCEKYGKTAAIEHGGFELARRVFLDCGYNIKNIAADHGGVVPQNLYNGNSQILFVNPSGNLETGRPLKMDRRVELIKWAKDTNSVIIEDDYNGELRYTSHPIPALQGTDSERVVYIGSFSKLLLPSVRIGYMVLPTDLLDIYNRRAGAYNQTASKVEQLALAEYIKSGGLERKLRRLRKLYRAKSEVLISSLKKHFGNSIKITLQETSLCVNAELESKLSQERFFTEAAAKSIRLGAYKSNKDGYVGFKLGFGGIPIEDIEAAVKLLKEINK